MEYFHLSFFSLGHLSNALISLVIGASFLFGGIRSAAGRLISLTFISSFIFSVFMFWGTVAYGAETGRHGYPSVIILLCHVLLIQLAYRYPRLYRRRESDIVLIGSIILVLVSFLDFNPPIVEYSYEVHSRMYRLPVSSFIQTVFALWIPLVLWRQGRRISQEVFSKIKKKKQIRLPKRVRILRVLAFLLSIYALLAFLAFLKHNGLVSSWYYHALTQTGLLFGQGLFVYIYLSYSREPVSFLVKLVGISLTAIVVMVQILLFQTMNWLENKYDDDRIADTNKIVSEVLRGESLALNRDVDYVIRVSSHRAAEPVYLRYNYPVQQLNYAVNTPATSRRIYVKGEQPSLAYQKQLEGFRYEVGFSYVSYRLYMHQYLLRFLFLLLALVILTLVIFPILFYKSITRPLTMLVNSLENVRRGHLKVNLPVREHDEVGLLTHSFNRMVQALSRADERLRIYTEKLEEKVDERAYEIKLRMKEIEEANLALQNEIAERRKLEKELRESQKFIHSVARSSPQVLFVYDIKNLKVRYMNHDTFQQALTVASEGSGTGFFKDILLEEDEEVYQRWIDNLKLAADNEPVDVEFRIKSPDRGPVWLFSRATVYARDEDGTVREIIGTCIDVTGRKVAEERVLYMARHDALTGLPNRLRLQERFAETVASAHINKEKIALLFLDLDRFKWVNDTLGHEIGDLLLKAVADKLRNCMAEKEVLARWGGDEFVILIQDQDIMARSEQLARDVLEALDEPFMINGHELLISGSIGIAIYPDHDISPRNLLRKADLAMYLAKEKGRSNYQYYKPELDHKTARLRMMEIEIWRAIENKEFIMYYQPIYTADTRDLVGVESLIRWQHPERGILYPNDFIEIAEETGQIIEIGREMLRQVATDALKWINRGYKVPVTFNVSNRQFRHESIGAMISDILAETGLPAEYLELELTEGILLDSAISSEEKLAALRKIGIRLSLDDFGTGYSSLSYLKKLRVNKLKIDKSFIMDLGSAVEDEPFIVAIVALARALKLPTVAEGVEREEQLSYLRNLGVDYIQGYLFARPMTIESLLATLK